MKPFLDLLATDCEIQVRVGIEVPAPVPIVIMRGARLLLQTRVTHRLSHEFEWPVREPIALTIMGAPLNSVSVSFDDWSLPNDYVRSRPGFWQFVTHDVCFYQWQHAVTGQGWLLLPTPGVADLPHTAVDSLVNSVYNGDVQ